MPTGNMSAWRTYPAVMQTLSGCLITRRYTVTSHSTWAYAVPLYPGLQRRQTKLSLSLPLGWLSKGQVQGYRQGPGGSCHSDLPSSSPAPAKRCQESVSAHCPPLWDFVRWQVDKPSLLTSSQHGWAKTGSSCLLYEVPQLQSVASGRA